MQLIRRIAVLTWLACGSVIGQPRAAPAPRQASRGTPTALCDSADPTCGALLVHPTGVTTNCVVSPTIAQCTNGSTTTAAQTESAPDPLAACPDDDLYDSALTEAEIMQQVGTDGYGFESQQVPHLLECFQHC